MISNANESINYHDKASVYLKERISDMNFDEKKITEYDSRQIPTIGINIYIKRWIDHANMDENNIRGAIILLERLINKSNIEMTYNRIHRLLLCSLLIIAKYDHDWPFLNSHYATIAGTSLMELNRLEKAFLRDIDWNIYISDNQWDEYKNILE